MKRGSGSMIMLALLALTRPGLAEEDTTRSRGFHGIAGAGLALEASNVEDWARTNGGGTDYDYMSGGIGADLYAGVEIMKVLSLRLGHHEFGEQTADAFNGGFYQGELTVDADSNYFAVDALYPFNELLQAGITLGSMTWDAERRFHSATGAITRSTESGRDPFAGLRGRLVFVERNAVITAFLNSYSLDTDNTAKEFVFTSLGVGIELRI